MIENDDDSGNEGVAADVGNEDVAAWHREK